MIEPPKNFEGEYHPTVRRIMDEPARGGFVERQLEVQRETYGINPPTMRGNERGNFVWDQVMAGIKEFTEVVDCYDAKPWRRGMETHGHSVVAKQVIAEELADVMIFVANIALLEGITTEDLLRTVDYKQRKNQSRSDHNVRRS